MLAFPCRVHLRSDTYRVRLDAAVLVTGSIFLISPKVPRGWVLATCFSLHEMPSDTRQFLNKVIRFHTLAEGTDKNFFISLTFVPVGTGNEGDRNGRTETPQENENSVTHTCFHLIQWQQLGGL